MPYADHFKLADDLISHLTPVVRGITDPFLASRYAGFVAVTAVTVYELAVKEILCTFGESKHSVLGNFTRSYFDRINGRNTYKTKNMYPRLVKNTCAGSKRPLNCEKEKFCAQKGKAF
jgi:hypothetical protein